MGKSVKFSIVTLAVGAVDRLLRNIIPLGRFFFLPWLVSTVLIILWHLFWHANLQTVLPRSLFTIHDLIVNLIWAPALAVITIGVLRWDFELLRWDFDARAIVWPAQLKPFSTLVLVTMLYGVLFSCYALIEHTITLLRITSVSWIDIQLDSTRYAPEFNTPEIPMWFHLFWYAGTWVSYVVVHLFFYAIIAVAVLDGQFNLMKSLQLIRTSPLRILGYLLVISAAIIGLNRLCVEIYLALGINYPIEGVIYHWRDLVVPSLQYHAVDSLRLFFETMLLLLALAEVYQVVTKRGQS